jgi:cytochrome b
MLRPQGSDPDEVKVWDPIVRLGHWSLVVLFAVAYLSGEIEVETLHAWAGYAILGIVLFRILWGFVGTRHARFADFVFGWRTTMAYARSLLRARPRHYLGHNPLGGWMVLALLVTLLLVSWSGLELYADEGKGPLAGARTTLVAPAQANGKEDREREDEGDSLWEDVHELLANFCLLLVALHIGGVLVSSLLHRENLVRAMITGKKRVESDLSTRV